MERKRERGGTILIGRDRDGRMHKSTTCMDRAALCGEIQRAE